MTVYLAFSELEGLNSIPAGVTAVTTGSSVVSGINRAGISLENQAAVAASLSTPINEGWAHCRLVPKSNGAAFNSQIADYNFSIVDGSGNRIAGFYQEDNNTSSPITWRATYFADASLFTVNGNSGVLIGNSSGGYDVDIHFKISDTGGFLRWYVNGVLVREVLGDTQPGASTVVASCRWRATGGATNTGAAHWTQFSQAIVADVPTIGARLHTLPLTVGTPNQWTGTPSQVTGTSSTGTISETVNDEEINFTAANLATAVRSGYYIDAVAFSARAQALSGSPVTQLQGRLRRAGTPYNVDAPKVLTTGFGPYRWISNTDPSTGLKWLSAGVDDAEFALQAKT